MKAVRIHQFGGPEVLTYEDIPAPEPRLDQVLVRVRACSLNHLDLWVRQGLPGVELPHILGSDMAGEVVETGEYVSGFKAGQRVLIAPMYFCGHCAKCIAGLQNQCREFTVLGNAVDGGNCELFAAPAASVIPIPDSLDFIQSASVPLVFVTAWHMLVGRAGRTGAQEDRRMERAGRCLVNRSFRLTCVVMIVLWKSHRPLWLFKQNAASDVEAAIKAATAATHAGDFRRAVKALMKLKGVGLKMASAILTAMFPTLYTVCDVRASQALGQEDYGSLRYYLAYLDYCRRTAAQYGVTLRDFDRANWHWSWEQSQNKRKRQCRKPCVGTQTTAATAA